MRRTLIAGNWKMNLDRQSATALASSLREFASVDRLDVAICPPFLYLDAVGNAIDGSPLRLGAQDCYFEESGAFTGETSAAMLRDMGCEYVILGHSERRNVIGESSELVHRKMQAALAVGLSPILCVGELLEQRESGETLNVVREQFLSATVDIGADAMANVIVAYEPVWAIGTGKTATPEQAQQVHADLRKIIGERYNAELAANCIVLYGGSVKEDNAAELLGQSDIDGALVGGASLITNSFLQIIAAGRDRAAG